MIQKLIRYSLVILLPAMIALGGCSKEDDHEKQYAEWKAKNEAFYVKASASKEYEKLTIPTNRGGGTVLYKVIKAGDPNSRTPYYNSTVSVHYKGELIDGTVFDKSFVGGNGPDPKDPTKGEWYNGEDIPVNFGVNNVIKGWTEILQIMHVGDRFKVVIPWKLAYGASSSGNYILPYSALIFEVELIEIVQQ